jgi:hypothetical protein
LAPGVTIFGDFTQLSAIFPNFQRKNGVCLKSQCYDQFVSKFSFVLSQKRQFFAKFSGEKILKIISSVPAVFLAENAKCFGENICFSKKMVFVLNPNDIINLFQNLALF